MDLQMSGHVAVVTGAASGIGWACARSLAREGCRVALWDCDADVERRAGELGVGSTGIRTDVCERAAVSRALSITEEVLGPVEHLVHAAAIGSGKFGFPFTNLDPDDWRRVLEVNLMGMVYVAHAIAPGMSKRGAGTFVFLASVAGQIGSQTDPPYSATKAATLNFAQCLAKDLAPGGVRVNCVNPGMVQTPLNRRVWEAWNDLQFPEQKRTYEEWGMAKIRGIVPLARWQDPDDVADMVTFLSSARASQVTGQAINVDGGQVMHW